MAFTSKNIVLPLDIYKYSLDNVQNQTFILGQKASQACNDLPKFVDTSHSVALEQLTEKAEIQQEKVNNICLLKHFIADYHDLLSWINGMKMKMLTDKIASDLDSAKALLERHQGYKDSTNIYEDKIKNVIEVAHKLIKGEVCSGEVKEKLAQLSASWNSLPSLWERRFMFHKQRLDLYLFYSKIDEISAWMTDQEQSFSANKHLEYSLSSLENLINNHEDISTTLTAKEEDIKQLVEFAAKLVNEKHYASDDISQCRDKFLERYAMLKELLLDECDLDCNEVKAWIDVKLKSVGKDSDFTYIKNIGNSHISKTDHRSSIIKCEDVRFEAQDLTISKSYVSSHNIQHEIKDILRSLSTFGEIVEKNKFTFQEANYDPKPGSCLSDISNRSPINYKNENVTSVEDLYGNNLNTINTTQELVSKLLINRVRTNANFELANEIINKRSEIIERSSKLKASLIKKNDFQVTPDAIVGLTSNKLTSVYK